LLEQFGGIRLLRFGFLFFYRSGTLFTCSAFLFHHLLGDQVFRIYENVAGVHECPRGLFLTDAHHEKAFFADAGGQSGVIAVAGNQAEGIHGGAVKQVHGVDDHGAVRGVLADGVAELLDGLNGVGLQCVLPAAHVGRGPIAVVTPDRDRSVFTGF
jgi:hypothetical protein